MNVISGGDLLDNSLSKSLKKIRAAKSRFHSLTSRSSSQAVLTSQIELCEILLDEIRSISRSLEKRKDKRSATSRRSVATRRNRGNSYRMAPRQDAPDRTTQRK